MLFPYGKVLYGKRAIFELFYLEQILYKTKCILKLEV